MGSMASSTDDVRYRLRGDLEYAEYRIGDQSQLVVKDRLKIDYFFFQSLELTALRLLEKPISISQLKSRIDERIAPAKIEFDEARMFVARLLSDNLLVRDVPGPVRTVGKPSKSIPVRIAGLLAIRFRGINPRWLLDQLNPYTNLLFSPFSFVVAFVLFAAAMLGLVMNVGTVFNSPSLWNSIVRVEILLPLGLAVVVTKSLHELGHALACRAIGRDCHEIGVMFLAFMPCFYCNVSDVWMEPNRWKRIMVSAAGIYVEMLIAAACVPLFLWCRPGMLQVFFFSLVVVSSVNTLFVNGNPLLKYDGYYIFSDLLQLPNMYGRAQSSWLEDVVGFFFQSSFASKQPFHWGLSLYGVLSFLYRCVVLGVIVWVVYSALSKWELNTLAWTISSVFAVAVAMQLLTGVASALKQLSSESGGVRKGRTIGCLAILSVILVLFFALPLASRIFARGKVVVGGNGVVYAPSEGEIEWHVSAGEAVVSGQPLATVSNGRLSEELLVRSQEVEQIQLSLNNQQVLLRQGAENQAEIQLLIQSLANAKKLRDLLLAEQKTSRVLAGVDGVVQPYPIRNLANETSAVSLTQSVVGFARRSEPLATITRPDSYEVQLEVAGSDAKFLKPGDDVRMNIDGSESRVFAGRVVEVGLQSFVMKNESRSASGGGSLEAENFVTVRVEFEKPPEEIRLESKVTAVAYGQKQTLFQMLLHRVRSNFKI